MKVSHITTSLIMCLPIFCQAQETAVSVSPDSVGIMPDKTLLHLPSLTERGTMPQFGYPSFLWGSMLSTWDLHQGLNVSLGASVFSTFGSGNTWSGAGFSQNVSLMYAMPLKNRWSLAVGGYLTNTSWSHDSFRDAGLSGILNYQINNKWDAYLYGQKSIIQTKNIPLPLYDIGDMGDRIGLGVNYKVTPSFSIGMQIEERFHNNTHIYNSGAARNHQHIKNTYIDDIPSATDNSRWNH